jgi:hypothetical protein
MSTESASVLGLKPSAEATELVKDIGGARRRAAKAEPGDRADVERFEALATQLEMLVDQEQVTRISVLVDDTTAENRYLLGGNEEDWGVGLNAEVLNAARSVRAQGLIPILRIYGLEPGAAQAPSQAAGIPNVADRFDSGGKRGRAAVEARFQNQIAKALDSAAEGGDVRPISPSGIHNPVVTEMLRRHVSGDSTGRIDVPVEYRDGSRSANPFPLRCLPLVTEIQGDFELQLKFALLSIRHTEMDAAVDGAWLRNAELSRPRPAALTDDLVFGISCAQLDELTDHGRRRVRIEMYQTGLETAVVGFYRAVTCHMLKNPRTLAVEPMYFASGSKDKKSAPFRRGTPWTM